ncbi:MAG: hypothetical protein HC927_11335 [Deltaproteobacteria bacterium]|nr:hypothetical protein [Deltaproteobacteria bacterium]
MDRTSWLEQILLVRGTPISKVWRRVVVTGLVALVITLLDLQWGLFHVNLTPLPFTLIGLALSIFLGFRNNTGYDRFWEGRKLWGSLVNVARSLTRQILTLIGPTARTSDAATPARLAEIRRELIYTLIAYVHALCHHLRDEEPFEALARLLPAAQVEALRHELNRPVAILQMIGDRLRAVHDEGLIDTYHLPVLDAGLTELTNIQGACERIKSTPIPASYTVLMHRIVLLYCMGLPFGIVETVGVATPLVVLIVAYAFYGLDAVGTEIENPFERDPNDLPLSTLTRMIEVNLRQRLGETELPPLLEPVDGVLN